MSIRVMNPKAWDVHVTVDVHLFRFQPKKRINGLIFPHYRAACHPKMK